MATDVAPSRSARVPWGLALGGLLLVVAGVVGYFAVVLLLAGRLAAVRSGAVPNWILIAMGIGLTVLAVRRAPNRWVPKGLLGVNVVLAGFFAHLLYVATTVPAAPGPARGALAPAFELSDQKGQVVRLSDFRGTPLLLVFYRGHW
jgi:hypothetical protein